MIDLIEGRKKKEEGRRKKEERRRKKKWMGTYMKFAYTVILNYFILI
ncbi:MAG: hypothetical protein SWX82_30895 [Cyanobacteriota bacterium]|nr:hypothetical protein [Cyanobacteriota bacterium]